MMLVVLTGASDSGKTAIADRYRGWGTSIAVRHFDSIGIPSAEEIAAFGSGYQPGGAWQRAMTLQWIESLVPLIATGEKRAGPSAGEYGSIYAESLC
jgi:hypothetical protein